MEKSNIKSMQLNECIKKLRFYHDLLETKYIILFTPLTFSYSSELHASLRRNSGANGSKFVNNFANISIFSKIETNSRILQKGYLVNTIFSDFLVALICRYFAFSKYFIKLGNYSILDHCVVWGIQFITHTPNGTAGEYSV